MVDVLPDLDPQPRRQAVVRDACASLRRTARRSRRAPAPQALAATSTVSSGGTGTADVGDLRRDRSPGGPLRRADRGRRSTCGSAPRASSGAGSTSSSRPTSSTRSTCRGSCWRGAARRGCRLAWCAAASSCRESTTLEAVAVPGFRAGRFDQLDEPSSPFNLGATDRRFVERREPAFGRDSLQGGVRLTSTTARVDWGVSVYRGLRGVSDVTSRLSPTARPAIRFRTSRDVSAVHDGRRRLRDRARRVGRARRGRRVRRRRAAVCRAVRGVRGRSVEGGVGVDRKAGDYRLAGNVLVSHRAARLDDVAGASRGRATR